MNLLEMSFSGAVFIIAVAVIRAAAIHRLPKKTFLVLWETVLLRLIIPFTIPSIFSVYTLIHSGISTPSFMEAETAGIPSAILQEHFSWYRARSGRRPIARPFLFGFLSGVPE